MFALMTLTFAMGCEEPGSAFGDGTVGPPGPKGDPGEQGPPGPPGGLGGSDAPTSASGSRLEVRYTYTVTDGDDGSSTVHGGLGALVWDTQRDEECTWATAEDGATRCLPKVTSYGIAAFGDAACTTEVRIFAKATMCGATGNLPDYFYIDGDSDPCTATTAVYQRGAEAMPQGPQWFAKSGALCVAVYAAADYAGYALGAHVPPTEFQSGQAPQTVTVTAP